MKRSIYPIILVVALALFVFAPLPIAAQDDTITIGMVNYTLCCAYFIGMSDAVQNEAAAYPNIHVIVTDANGDAEKLTSDVEDVLAQGVDGIIISGGPLEAAPAALDAIKAAGVPVVLVDRQLKGGDYTSWIGPDNYQIGVQDGQYIVDRLGGQGTIVVLRGGPADNSIGLNRTNGMLSIVDPSDINVITAPDFGGWSEDGGFTLMEDLLAQNDQINAVFCENDSMCLGAQKAIDDAGRSSDIFLVAVDGQKEALLQILNGTNYAATGLNNSDQIGRAAFNRLMAILAGAQAPHDTVLPSPVITSDNVIKFYDPNSVF
ncbi:MAG: substrate-binding domain-containing protein [Anaerolineae bacterium]